MSGESCGRVDWSTRGSISRVCSRPSAWESRRYRSTSPARPENAGAADMSNTTVIDPAVWRVLEEYEVRARREDELWSSLEQEELRQRLDEFLLPVGRAAGTLMNLIVKEGQARRILEVGSSYGYSTVWLAEAARTIDGKVISLELRAAKTEYARAQLARAELERFVEFRVGDALTSLPLSAISTRLLRLPSLRIFNTRIPSISAMSATWVPPQGCRSIPGILSSRTRPAPRGGCTLMVLTSSGCASSSASVIHTVSVAAPAAMRALVSRSIRSAFN